MQAGRHLAGMGLDYFAVTALMLSSCGFFFVFGCRLFFFFVCFVFARFQSFLSMVIQQLVLILMFL